MPSPVFNKKYDRQIEVKDHDPRDYSSYMTNSPWGWQLFAEKNKALVKAVKSFIRKTTADYSNCNLPYIHKELKWRFWNLEELHLLWVARYLDYFEDYNYGSSNWDWYIVHEPH